VQRRELAQEAKWERGSLMGGGAGCVG
jgi:hypothetical protein